MTQKERNKLCDKLADKLPTLRKELGVSQQALADMTGLSRSTITKVEGKSLSLTWSNFLALFLIFKANPETEKLLKTFEIDTDSLDGFLSHRTPEKPKLIEPGTWYAEFDENGKCTCLVYDKSLCRLLGYESDEEYNNVCRELGNIIHPDDREKLDRHIAECTAKHPEGMDYDIEYRIMTKWGYRWLHDHAHIIRRQDGSAIRADGVSYTIEEIIRGQEAHLALTENYSCVIAFFDSLEVLYDVELATGKYRILSGSKTYEAMYSSLIDSDSFWDDLDNNLVIAHPDDRQLIREAMNIEYIRETLAENDYYDFYVRILIDGRYVLSRIRTVYKNHKKENIIVGIFNAENDFESKLIAEQKQQLEESLAFTNFFLNTYVSAYFVDLDTCACQIYTRTKKLEDEYPVIDNYLDGLTEYISRDVHPDDRAELISILTPDNLKRKLNEVSDFTHIFRDISDNTEKYYKVQVIRGIDKCHVALGFTNVTEEFREQKSRLLGAIPLSSDILTKASIGLWSFELDDGCAPRMYADEAMLKLIGLDHQISPEETYHAWYDNIDEGSYDLVADAVAKMTSGEHAEVQYPWHHPNGETWIVRCGGVRNPEYTKGIRIEGVHQNVSELLHYDEEQRKREEKQRLDELARVKAEASDKAKTEFLFNMSHDIRTPMNAILGYTDIAMNHIGEQERVEDSLAKIKTSGGHLLKLINDILEMSRIEAGKLEIVKVPLSIIEASDGVGSMSQALADKNDITFRKIVGDLKNPYIYADELHTNQILINIISNAIKYTNPGGTVIYKIEQLGSPTDGTAWYRFTISDNGIGMSDEFQKHIFESFSREQSSTVSKLEGTGLGLAIVKKIVDKIGGTITVHSKLGEGSTFVVDIPFEVLDDEAIKAFTASRRKESCISALVSFDGMKALLVEDNELNREIATEILKETGLDLETAEDGAIAVKKISEKGTGYYDFVLMDIQMPVMDGYEATSVIRKLPGGSELPIIALSANAFKEDIDTSLAAGMNAHVSKPIDIKNLLDVMSNLAQKDSIDV